MVDVAPSKTELLDRRGERDLVREGKAVLEERRDLLARMMWEQIGRVELLESKVEAGLELARAWSRRAVARHGVKGVLAHGSDNPPAYAAQWQAGNRFGTVWLELSNRETEQSAEPSSQDPRASLELDGARAALDELLELLIELAGAEGNLVRLAHGFRRTQRRVNALEHIILPELDRQIGRIQSAMEEVERDDLVRSSLIKRRQAG